MSEKAQRTVASLREKMLHRYGDGYQHKHDKSHHPYRKHYPSHPCNSTRNMNEMAPSSNSTGLLKKYKLRKIRKRLDKGHFH
ncbi:hypothetical protein E3983_00640 [Legionella israelensis]|uniref:Uncharacterized protein n=1 Tax=Legionella israelensis TaxID=454 RepID=A0A0W0V1P4_9GAMM|nr:hypothetical protein [Legionella israelensis]KTD14036.1 hypothetical protein Lisr_2812 [Legionella israelensis]QBR82989.1 hypothetical protein E3983_00640 [Legionella israelensis]QBS09691.1 hypothetical protein E4T55_07350 [Legionella israelensis]SCY04366.1 hypothetical protein SAMN02746069_01090 [Legionella israelensis DSM 19235]STX60627.1 Uncharacterised protein [Legionella israelensis]